VAAAADTVDLPVDPLVAADTADRPAVLLLAAADMAHRLPAVMDLPRVAATARLLRASADLPEWADR